MMTDDVIAKLKKKEDKDPFHEKLLEDCLRDLKESRTEMSKHYDDWDLQDSVYRGEIIPDIEDRKQEERKKPVKMVVPNTFAQVQTFTSFLFLLLTQNEKFYTLGGSGDEDYGKKLVDSETLLAQNLVRNEFNTKLFQTLLDVPRFGVGILESCWTRQITHQFIQGPPRGVTVNGQTLSSSDGGSWVPFVKYEGNEIKSVSPYKFFPDPQFPLTEFQKGTFCAVEEEYSMTALRGLESDGEVAGVEHIEALPANYEKARGGVTRWSLRGDESRIRKFDVDKGSSVVLVTKVQKWIVPNKYELDNGKVLGEQEFPVLYHVWYANDNRIIRVEPAYWWHAEFGWAQAQYTPDMHQTINCGMADLIYRLQEVISWYINSHITSVRRVIQNRFIVDPRTVDTKSLDGEGDIYLRKGVNMPLDRAIGQLKVQDVTGNHMSDADMLNRIMQVVTGCNDNMHGQYNQGRRSAAEARVVTAGAAGRMKMHAALIWESCFSRLGRHLLSNLRQNLSFESFMAGVGQGTGNMVGLTPEQDIQQRYMAFRGTPQEVICGQDFFVFDSTLASERSFIAQSLQELLIAIMSQPQLALQFDLSPKAMIDEIQHLRGAGSTGRFSLSARVRAGQEAPPMPVPVPGTAKPSAA